MGKYLGKLLKGTLDGSMDEYSKYPRMHYRSFNWIKRNYYILREFGFSDEKVSFRIAVPLFSLLRNKL